MVMLLKESETLELKKSTSELKEAVISIAAILNKHGKGRLYFGVKNDGKVTGQQVGGATLREVSRAIADHIEPRIYPSVNLEVLEGKPCVVVDFRGEDVPYYAYGRAYMRVADENKQVSARELERIILDKNKEKMRWDSVVCRDARISDIDGEKFTGFLKSSGLEHSDIQNSLKKLKLLSGGRPVNAAILLFGKKPQDFFPNARLRCASFATSDTTMPLDMKDFEGDLFYLIGKAQEYILQNIHIGMRLEGLRRIDVPEIDRDAFREAVINAFCHRDYREYDSVNIAVFRDRLEIRSPGLLYGGLTISRIRKEMVSERRNELIADIFHRVHFIEKWGRGIKLIISREPATKFAEIGTHFIVTFRRKGVDGAAETSRKTREKTSEKTSEKKSEKTSEKILHLIAGNNKITIAELAEVVGVAPRSIERNIQHLQKQGLLRRIGPDKGGHWEVSS
jgi:ATP-dependent DNA helicase RecG